MKKENNFAAYIASADFEIEYYLFVTEKILTKLTLLRINILLGSQPQQLLILHTPR